ncbi:MAG: rhamnulokinase, partial [Alistipes sp.]|nr:rhamnulokinase [Alistipes sp.]
QEWPKMSYGELIAAADEAEPFRSLFNPDADCFANPDSMTTAIADYCRATDQPVPESIGEYVRAIFESLALRYRQVVEMMRELSPTPINRLYVIGGGARNETLNQFTASAIGIPVETGSAESTAIGNVMMQAKWVGVVDSIDAMRSMIRSSIDDRRRYEPQQSEVWSAAYEKFLSLYREM